MHVSRRHWASLSNSGVQPKATSRLWSKGCSPRQIGISTRVVSHAAVVLWVSRGWGLSRCRAGGSEVCKQMPTSGSWGGTIVGNVLLLLTNWNVDVANVRILAPRSESSIWSRQVCWVVSLIHVVSHEAASVHNADRRFRERVVVVD